MPGEPILIVDDTPINLKLTRILLEHQGYEVRTANGAEEALQVLESFHPRLVLADIQMPGVDGLEMTRRIKQDPRNADMLVVALTALAREGDEEKAIAAGCDGYITKPIDTQALAARIRDYLQGRSVQSDADDLFAYADIDDLRRRFLEEARGRLILWVSQLDQLFDAAGARAIAHQWVGTGGLLGFSRLSMLARELESILRVTPLETSELRERLGVLQKELERPSIGAPDTAPAPPAKTAARPLVVIAGGDAYMRELGKALFESQDIECRTASDGPAALAAVREFRPRAVVLDVDLAGMNGREVMAALRAEGSPVKVLLLAGDENPECLGADDFLVKPFNPVELFVRVKRWV
jgi:two-component system, cell cycle response regulator DivK